MQGNGAQRAPATTIMKSSSRLWLMVHVGFPLLPFSLEAFLRLWITRDASFAIFNASNLAMSMGLLALFVSQSLANASLPLRSGDRKDDIEFKKLLFVMSAIFCFVFFSALVVKNNNDALSASVLLVAAVIVFLAYRTQKEFDLRAVI